MRALRIVFIGLMITLATGFTGCCGGGSTTKTETKSTTTTTTLGDELKDLKDAYDKGIISEKEYNESKEKIIKQRTEGR
jgi:hypothetical protein